MTEEKDEKQAEKLQAYKNSLSDEELEENRRSKSSKLRVFERS